MSHAAFQRVDLDIDAERRTYTHTWTDDSGTVQTMTPHLRRGDGELRQLVRVLPHAHPGGEDGDLAGVPRQDDDQQVQRRRPVPRRLAHAVQLSGRDVRARSTTSTRRRRPRGRRSSSGIKIPHGQETPNLNAIVAHRRVLRTAAATSGSTDPIVLSCQKNWHMLFTDGLTNQRRCRRHAVGDQDDTIPAASRSGATSPYWLDPGAAVAAAVPRGHVRQPTQQLGVRPRDLLLGHRPAPER